MMVAILTGCSLVFGTSGLLFIYSKIMQDLKDKKADWEKEKEKWNKLNRVNQVIS